MTGENSSEITMDDVNNLIKKKDEIEEQIKAYYEVLEDVSYTESAVKSALRVFVCYYKSKHVLILLFQQGVGVEGPLVDAEGYPRADVNLYQIRTARHNISCKQPHVRVSTCYLNICEGGGS